MRLAATLDAAVRGAELAVGEGPARIFRVEPTAPIEDDPHLTDKKLPGNPTRSYRTRHPLRVVGEVLDWEGHPPQVLQAMRDHLEELKRLGTEAINDCVPGPRCQAVQPRTSPPNHRTPTHVAAATTGTRSTR